MLSSRVPSLNRLIRSHEFRDVVATTSATRLWYGTASGAARACGHFPYEWAALKRLYLATLAELHVVDLKGGGDWLCSSRSRTP